MELLMTMMGLVFLMANFITILDYWADTKPMIEEIHARTRLGNDWYEERVVLRRKPMKNVTHKATRVTNAAEIFGPISEKVIHLPPPTEDIADARPPWEE